MIRKLSTNETIVLDSCTTTIDYLYVDDFCNAVTCIIDSHSTGVFNICSGNEYPIKSIIERLHQLTKSSGTITFDTSRDRVGISNYICGSSDKIRALGWRPMFEIEDGLRSTYNLSAVNTE
jgi:nucleoside-diphosphate-sugar epimerase